MKLIELLILTVACGTISLIAYWLINRPIRLEKMKMDFEEGKARTKVVTPIKLNAYERLVLFLERNSPDEILNREMEPKMSCFDLQMRLLKVMRQEFEHNVSQQIYVSKAAWQAVTDAKENMVQLVNMCATQVSSNEPALRLAQTIIATYNSTNETAVKNAINLLKNEIGRLIN
jgi:HAMP domain-containing protein